MNILFISYWGIHDGLSRSTVIPHVKILSEFNEINKIYVVTIERGKGVKEEFLHNKIKHIPIYSRSYVVPFLDKLIDFIRIPSVLAKLVFEKSIENVIARGSPAGAFAYLLWKRTRIPFYVESFEPHADYMLETGTWKKWDIRYLLQKRWEKKQCVFADGLMPVAKNYEITLISEGIDPERIYTIPCSVDLNQFKFDLDKRSEIRKKLRINTQTTGIYVGKFGGLYMEDEAFRLIEKLFGYLKDFFLIILSPDSPHDIIKKLSNLNISDSKYFIKKVPHSHIPQYLSASDFGLALYKSFPSNKYLSPIKVGEYWANGLPVLLTQGVGDESQFMEDEEGGAFFDVSEPVSAIKKIEKIMNLPDHRSLISQLAEKYRSFDRVRDAYKKLVIDS